MSAPTPRHNIGAYRLKVLPTGAGMWLCARSVQAGSFYWPCERSGSISELPTVVCNGFSNAGTIGLVFLVITSRASDHEDTL